MRRPALAGVLRGGCPLLIAGIVFLCFAPVLGNEFVNWDDLVYFTDNIAYRGVSISHLRWMFTTLFMGHYQPLTWLTHGLVYMLWGINPTAYHMVNLAVHVANAVLFYFLILSLFLQLRSGDADASRLTERVAATVGGLFFAIHPLRVEAVAWATERQEVLCAFFLLLTLLAYLRMQRAEHMGRAWWTWYAASLWCFALSLLSKAASLTLPFVLVVLDVYPLRRFSRAAIVEKMPYAALAAGATVLVALAKEARDMLTLAEHGVVSRIMQAMYGLSFYVYKTAVPFGLSPLYLLRTPLHPTEPRFVVSAVSTIGVTACLIRLRHRYPWALTAWVCYAITVLPMLGLAQAGPQIAADRYTYLACLPWAVLVAAGVRQLGLLCAARRGQGKWIAAAIVMVLAGLGVLTVKQTRVWRSSLTLWTHVLAVEPMNRTAYNNRAGARRASGDLDGALADATEALRLDPEYRFAYMNRAQIRMAKSDPAGAFADYDQYIHLEPTNPSAYVGRGNARQAGGDLQGAIADFTTAMQLNPQLVDAYYNRGNARKAAGDLAGAVADYTAALELNPQLAAAYNNRGTTLREQGNPAAALADYDRALRINPRYTMAYLSRAGARRATGDLAGAVADYAQALQLTPPADTSRSVLERKLAALRQETTGRESNAPSQ